MSSIKMSGTPLPRAIALFVCLGLSTRVIHSAVPASSAARSSTSTLILEINDADRKTSTFNGEFNQLLTDLGSLQVTPVQYFAGVPHLYVEVTLPPGSADSTNALIDQVRGLPGVASAMSLDGALTMLKDKADLRIYSHAALIDPLDLAGFHQKQTSFAYDTTAPQTGEIIVKYMENVANSPTALSDTISNITAIHNQFTTGTKRVYKNGYNYKEIVKLAPGADMRSAIEAYLASPLVEYAQPNYLYGAKAAVGTPTAAYLTQDGGWGFSKISSQSAWSIFPQGSAKVLIGLVDSGISLVNQTSIAYRNAINYYVTPHPDLAANLWNNPDVNTVVNFSEFQDGESSLDGQYGFNLAAFVGSDTQNYDINTGHNYLAYDLSSYSLSSFVTPDDDDFIFNGVYGDGHGTRIAGIIGGVGNGAGNNVAGVAYPVASIMSVKSLWSGSGVNMDVGTSETIANGLEYAIGNVGRSEGIVINHDAAKIVNLASDTWGTLGTDNTVSEAVQDVLGKTGGQTVFVVAAGNENSNIDLSGNSIWPACYNYPNMVVVGASDKTDNVANFGYTLTLSNGAGQQQISNYGQYSVDVFAPGVDSWTTDTSNRYYTDNGNNALGSGYVAFQNAWGGAGTSIATGYVSGMLALASSMYPWESGIDLANRARFSVDNPTTNNQSNLGTDCLSGGRINAFNALGARPAMMNMSTRAWIGTGLNALDVSFYIYGSPSAPTKTIAIQAIGPGLAPYVSGPVLQTPQVQFYNWNGQLLFTVTGYGPSASVVPTPLGASMNLTVSTTNLPGYAAGWAAGDTAFSVTLPSTQGPNGTGLRACYSAIMQNAAGQQGQGLCAVYDLSAYTESASFARLTNLSTRAFVGSVNGVWYPAYPAMSVAGGNFPRGVMFETEGPGLVKLAPATFNAGNVLANPTFTYYGNSFQETCFACASSNTWGVQTIPSALANRLNNAGFLGLGGPTIDCALYAPLSYGNSSAIVGANSSNTGGGVVVISAYEY